MRKHEEANFGALVCVSMIVTGMRTLRTCMRLSSTRHSKHHIIIHSLFTNQKSERYTNVLISIMEQVKKEDLPIETKIVQEGEHYEFK
jgi:hypothetical protein